MVKTRRVCGISVVYSFAYGAPPVDRNELLRTGDAMQRRGPDGSGEWLAGDGRVGMAHRRLAIIDPSPRGAQPMASAGGRFSVVFNGEIYNYRKLREELEREGVRFHSHSDTEVLLHLYDRRGTAMLDVIRGMFALAIWDSQTRRLFVARDPYGIKPLYYCTDGGVFRAASQVKALIAGGGVSRTPSAPGLAGFLLRGAVPEPFTTYEAIKSVPAGSFLFVDENGATAPKSYFSIAAELRRGAETPFDPTRSEQIVREALLDSVRHHLLADVPVGAFLSAGKDSTTIVALARELGASLRTLTVGIDEFRNTPADELPLAREVARSLGVEHTAIILTREEFHRELPRALDAMDQPTIDALNSYFVSRAAAQAGIKVALSGTGGDELFGGYSSFRRIPRTVRWAGPVARLGVGPMFRKLHSAITPKHRRFSPKTAGIFEYGGTYAGAYFLRRGLFMPWELPSLMGVECAGEGLAQLEPMRAMHAALDPDPGTPHARVVALESTFYLRDVLLRDIDWASMAHSLEVRVPMVDVEFLRAVAPVVARVTNEGKRDVIRAPRLNLPAAIANRPKSGFALPLRRWLVERSSHVYGMREWALELYSGITPLRK